MTRARAAWAAGILLILFTGLGRLPLLDPDEGRYARSAQEMIERGDLVVPWFEGRPRLEKPVLFYWLEIAGFGLLGVSEAGARLPSALAAAGTLAWLFAFARKRSGERTALAACAILATTPLFFGLARTATTDMVLAFFVFGATVSLYAGIVEPASPRRHLIVAGVCLGLGMLTKGPVVLVAPVLAIPAAALARKREPITIAGRLVGVAWIMVAVALPWAALLFGRLGWEEVLEIWRREALERYAGGGLDHPESILYFARTAPVTFFPWSAFAPFAAVAGLRRLRWGDGLMPLLLTWSLGGLAFFSLGRGKLDSYLLPLAPAAAYLIALSLEPALRETAVRWATRVLAGLSLLGAAAMLAGLGPSHDPVALPALALVFAGAAGLCALVGFARRAEAAATVLQAGMGAFLLGAVLLVPLPWASERSTRELVREADLARAPGELYVLRVQPPSLGFYANRTATHVPARFMLVRMIEDERPASIVLESRRDDVIKQLLARGFRVSASSGRLVAMRREAVP